MDYKRANLEIVKAILNSEPRVCGYWMDENLYFITTNGFYGYALPKNWICFNTEKVKTLEKPVFNVEDFGKPEQEIKPTRQLSELTPKKFVRHFVGSKNGQKWKTYIDRDFLKPLIYASGIRYFQQFKDGEPSPISPVLAMEEKTTPTEKKDENGFIIWETELKPIMLLLPVRVCDFEEESEG